MKLGLAPEQVIGTSVYDVYKNHPEIESNIREALDNHEITTETMMGDIALKVNVSPLLNDKNQVTGVVGTALDITERKIAERALRKEHDRFTAIMDSIDAMVYAADMQTHELLYLNQYAKQITGDAVGEKCWKVLQKNQEGPCDFCTNDKLLDSQGRPNAPYIWELQNTRDNEWYHCRDQAIEWPDGRMVRLEIASNITNRVLVEKEHQKSKATIESIFRVAPAGIGMVKKRVINNVNNTFCKMLGYAEEELLGQSARILYPTEKEFNWVGEEKYRQIAATGVGAVETRMAKKNGEIIHVLLSSSPLNREDLDDGVIFTALEITDRITAEYALRESETRYRTMFEHAGIMLSTYDKTGTCILMNKNTAKQFNGAPEDFIGKTYLELHPDMKDTYESISNAVINQGKTLSFEDWVEFPAGSRYLVSTVLPLRNLNDEIYALQIVSQDFTERNRAIKALKESEQKYRRMFERAGVLISTYDSDGICIAMNDVVAQSFNGKPEDFIGKPFKVIHPLLDSSFEQRLYDVIENNEIRTYEDHIQFPQGDRWLISSVFPVTNEAGKTFGAQIVSQDITDRNRALKELKESEQKYRSMFEHAGVFMSVYDYEANILAINTPAAKSLFGEPDDLVGKNLFELFPDFPKYLMQRVRDVIDSGETKHFEEKVVAPNGTKWLVSTIMPMRNEEGTVYAAQILSHDFTAQIEATENLKIQEQRFKTFFSAISDAIFVHPFLEEGFAPFEEVNQVAIDRYGYTRDEWMKLTAEDITVKTFADEHGREERRKELKESRYKSFEAIHIKKSGEEFPVEIRSTVVEQFEKPIILTVVRDLTKQKQAEAEQEKLRVQLNQAQKMESIGRLAGGVAHDFNNMLGVILGNVELAMLEFDKNEELYKDLDEIRSAANRSADLTRQLLAFARKQTITPKILDLNDVISGMLTMLTRLIGEDVELKWLPATELGLVKIDPAQVDQVLANLCVNARDAIENIGHVTIETHNVTIDEAFCRINPGASPGDYVMLAVSDNGCGMDEDVQKNLFEPFFTTKGVHEGTGLGLATVFGIVKQNKGFLNVYSEVGKGSTFKIYFPGYHSVSPSEEVKKETGKLHSGSEVVLLVEDEPAILRIGQKMLEKLGYRVLIAGTPGEAIEVAEKFSGDINLLITDVVMPEMNGRELAKTLMSRHPEMKRLFMSGYTANVIAHHGVLDEGVNFIQKPFTARVLSEKVKNALKS